MPQPTKQDLLTLKRYEALMQAIELPYIQALKVEKNRYIREISEYYKTSPDLPFKLLTIHKRNIFAISERYNVRAINVFVKDFYATYAPTLEKKQTAFDFFLMQLFQYWIDNETAVMAIETAETTHEDIKHAIAASVANNETSAQTAAKILKVRGLSSFRAATIALTETHNAAMYANFSSAQRLERESNLILGKYWIPVEDERTRSNHRAMASHPVIDMNEKFKVGGTLMSRPGDPNGGTSNVIRCRCALGYKVIS